MGAAFRFIELELRTPRDDDLAVIDVLLQCASKRKDARLGAIFDQRQHIDAERLLQRGVLEEVVEHLHRLRIALEFDYRSHTAAVRLVAKIADTVEFARLCTSSAMRSSKTALLTW